MSVFKSLQAGEQDAKENRRPQAFLHAIAVIMDQAVMRPSDRGARAQQDQRVEQRQIEGIEHCLNRLGWPVTTHNLGHRRK